VAAEVDFNEMRARSTPHFDDSLLVQPISSINRVLHINMLSGTRGNNLVTDVDQIHR